MDALKQLGPLDYCYIAIFGGSIVLGAMRGLIQVTMSLMGWGVALACAYYASSALAPYITPSALGEPLRFALTFLALLIASLVAWHFVTSLLKHIANNAGLSKLDHTLGGIFGMVRGGIILLVITALIAVTPFAKAPTWQQSRAVQSVQFLSQLLKPILPAAFAKFAP